MLTAGIVRGGQDARGNRESLKGLERFSVTVRGLPGLEDDTDAEVLSRTRIKTISELRLRQLGVTVNDDRPVNGPYLVIHAYVMPVFSGRQEQVVAYSMIVFCTVRQPVVPQLGDDPVALLADTWTSSYSTFVRATKDAPDEALQRRIEEAVDEFCNSYLAENPRKGPIDPGR